MRTTIAAAIVIGSAVPASAMAQDPTTPQQIMTGLQDVYGKHPGFRKNHAKGVCATGYFVGDAMVLMAMGVASSFISALVLSLYVNTTIAQQSYAAPTLLWLMVPLILFWQCRLWLATTRGHMLDDPILYSAKDWVSWIAFGLIGVVYAVATVGLW